MFGWIMPGFGSSLDCGDSDVFCISVILHLSSADDTDKAESCSGKHVAMYTTCDAECHGNNVVGMSVAAAAEDNKLFVFYSVYFRLDHWHYTHCYPELL